MKHNLKFLFKLLFILFLLFFYFVFSAYSYAYNYSNKFYSSFFRLHVIANSNLKIDQDLKYKVRDAVLIYLNNISSNISSVDEYTKLIEENTSNINKVASDIIISEGFDYPVKVKIGKVDFPTRYYTNFSLPSGCYNSLEILIGNHEGENWWCVMFPPLCFINLSSSFDNINLDLSNSLIENNLSDEEYNIISSDNTNSIEYKFKFKLLEAFQNVKNKT